LNAAEASWRALERLQALGQPLFSKLKYRPGQAGN